MIIASIIIAGATVPYRNSISNTYSNHNVAIAVAVMMLHIIKPLQIAA